MTILKCHINAKTCEHSQIKQFCLCFESTNLYFHHRYVAPFLLPNRIICAVKDEDQSFVIYVNVNSLQPPPADVYPTTDNTGKLQRASAANRWFLLTAQKSLVIEQRPVF
jgi:hypothetical protein